MRASPGPATHRQFALERVIYSKPFEQALAEELALGTAERVFVVTTPRQRASTELAQIETALGNRFAGSYPGVTAHVPIDCIIEGSAFAREARADLLLAFGGGSVIDAAKVMLLALWRGLTSAAQLQAARMTMAFDPSVRRAEDANLLRMIALPTTLSAAEFTAFGGVTDTELRRKYAFAHPLFIPQAVIYDPRLTVGLPLPLFLATGMTAVDHAAERLAGLNAQPFNDAVCTKSLQMLARALPQVQRDPGDLDARLECQLGAWLSMAGAGSGVGVGASHAIGHVLGAHTGVAHGLTSCTVLAAVMRWNLRANRDRQALVSAALGREDVDAGDAIDELVKSLALPTRLHQIGVKREQLEAVAAKACEDPPMKTNPRPVTDPAQVSEILALAF